MTAAVGVISDTHGLLRPEAVAALAGSTHIIHAGDVGPEDILQALRGIAPTTVVRGNVDRESWAESLPEHVRLSIGGRSIYVLHDLHALDFDPAVEGIEVIVSGHSHQPKIERRGGVLYLNPGSAGKRRFRLPITLARLEIAEECVDAKLIHLL